MPAVKQQQPTVVVLKEPAQNKRKKRFYPYARYAKQMRDGIATQWPRGSEGSKGFWGPSYAEATPLQKMNRKVARFYGAGRYNWRDIPKYGLRAAGAIAGGLGAIDAGPAAAFSAGQAGWNTGARISKFMGYGDYEPVATNSLMDNVDNTAMNSQQNIQVNSTSVEGDVVIQFTEFVQNVSVTVSGTGTTAFAVQSFSINPGLSAVFPWLSQVANNFTLYEFDGLIFQYKPTSGEFGSTNSNSLGKVIMCTNYDPDAAAFSNSQEMENYDYAVATKPSCGMVHGVETHPSQRLSNQLYVRNGNSSKDKVLTDVGLFQVATEGIYVGAAGTFVIGELWVTYKIKLSRKLLGNAALGSNILYDMWYNTAISNSMVYSPGSTLGGTLTNPTGSTLHYVFPIALSAGYYTASLRIQSTENTDATTPLVLDFPSQVNCELQDFGLNNVWVYPNGLNNDGTTSLKTAMGSVLIKINAPGSLQASFSVTSQVETIEAVTFCITQVSAALWNDSYTASV